MGTFRQKVQATTNWVKSGPEDLAEPPKPSLFARRRSASPETGSPAAPRRRKAPPPPITAHRLFPAFAALWFAALFGLGSLAISSEVLGALVVKLGLPALVPAAAPPLGFTAHLLVAFALTVVGAALGLVLGLRLRPGSEAPNVVVAAPAPAAEPEVAPLATDTYKVRARDAHPDAPPRRPLVLTEAFADPISDTHANAPEEPEVPLLRRKPGASQPAEVAAEPAPWMAEFTPGGPDAVQPLDLATLDLAALDLADPVDEAASDEGAVEAVAEPEAPSEPAAPTAAEPVAAPLPLPAAPTLIAGTPQLPAGYAATLPEALNGGWSPVAGAPLENLGLVQLIERLALAMAARKAGEDGGTVEHEAAPEPETDTAGPISMPQAPISPAAAPLQGSARDEILRRLSEMAAGDMALGHDGGSNAAPPFSRPAAGKPSAEAPAEGVVPLHPEPVAQRAAPSFTRPASASVPFETDEALRSALATLQRMTARA